MLAPVTEKIGCSDLLKSFCDMLDRSQVHLWLEKQEFALKKDPNSWFNFMLAHLVTLSEVHVRPDINHSTVNYNAL